MAGVLAAGPRSLLARESAAELWGLLKSGRNVDVLRPHGLRPNSSRLRPPGVPSRTRLVVRRSRWIPPEHVAVVDGVPVTSVVRVLLDLACFAPDRQLRAAFNAADRLELLDVGALRQCMVHAIGRKGARRFRRLVETRHPEIVRTRSDLEAEFMGFCRKHDLGKPEVNSMVAGFEVDVYWPERRLVVELDSYRFHRGRMHFERDLRRDYELKCQGYAVVRLTGDLISRETNSVVRLLRRELGIAPQ
jgi:very-short-patch-repair endonuclease